MNPCELSHGASTGVTKAKETANAPLLRSLYFLPFAVILFTRMGIECSVRLFPMRYAWIPSFLLYYGIVAVCHRFVQRGILRGQRAVLSYAPWPVPGPKAWLFGVVLPAMPTFGFFLLNFRAVPVVLFGPIIAFALINPIFEETFWRGIMNLLPAPRWIRILYSGFLFSFAHYSTSGAYWLSNPRVLTAVVICTFLMGVGWMWLYQRQRTLFYPILGHAMVDVLNLSVAVFSGVQLVTVRT